MTFEEFVRWIETTWYRDALGREHPELEWITGHHAAPAQRSADAAQFAASAWS